MKYRLLDGTIGILIALSVIAVQAVAEPPQRVWSFQPKPSPETRHFLITEGGMLFSPETVGLQDQVYGPNYMLFWDAGLMTNISRRTAIGGSLGFTQGNNTEEFSLALKPRFRYWIGRRIPLDVSVGLPIFSNGTDYDPRPQFMVDATVMYYDWIGVTTRLLTTHIGPNPTVPVEWPGIGSASRTEFYAGLRLGSYPGLIGGGAAAIGVVIINAIFPED